MACCKLTISESRAVAEGVKRTSLDFDLPFTLDVGAVMGGTEGIEQVRGFSVGIGAGMGRGASIGDSESGF